MGHQRMANPPLNLRTLPSLTARVVGLKARPTGLSFSLAPDMMAFKREGDRQRYVTLSIAPRMPKGIDQGDFELDAIPPCRDRVCHGGW